MSPAQLKRRSTAALLGIVVLVFMKRALTLGKALRDSTGPRGALRYWLTSGVSSSVSSKVSKESSWLSSHQVVKLPKGRKIDR